MILDSRKEPEMTRPEIDFEAAGAIDLRRLERSLLLHSERVDAGQYHVTGGAQAHWVDLVTRDHPRCDCGDHLWRDAICKHMLAALLREGDERVLASVGELVQELKGRAAA